MNTYFFLVMMFGLQLLYWYIGKRASQNLKNKDDYFLAGKNVRFFPLMMTFLATQVGGGLILGAAEEAYQYGWSVLLYPLGMALGLISLGLGLGRRIAAYQVTTIAQILEVAYRSPLLKKIASFLSVVSLFMILVGQVVASRKFLMAMGLTSTPLFILFWAIIIFYTVRGGLRAVIATDLSQGIFFTLVFLFSFAFVAWTTPYVPSIEPFAAATSKMSSWLLLPCLFMVIGQDMGQRCFAGDSPRTVSRAAFWAGVGMMIVCVVPVFFGITARNLGLTIPPGASVFMVTIGQLTNPWIFSLVGCAVLAAIISTATSLISAISSNLLSDFVKRSLSIPVMKGVTAGFSIAAVVFAFYCTNIVDILIQSYELSISCLCVPILMALLQKREGNFLAAALSIVCGMGSFLLFKFVTPPFSSEIISIAISFAGFGAGELIGRRRKTEVVA